MNYERFFVSMKERVANDLGKYFDPSILDHLSLSLNHLAPAYSSSSDQYRSKKSKVPAYYNPNTHTVHFNLDILDTATPELVENIYYHELIHAASNHTRLMQEDLKVLKSGLKVQVWDENDQQVTLHRGLNEGVTQYFANSYTDGGTAYKNEVSIVGHLVSKIGLTAIRAAYFGPNIDLLEEQMRVRFGEGIFQEFSEHIDKKRYDEALALIS